MKCLGQGVTNASLVARFQILLNRAVKRKPDLLPTKIEINIG